MPLDERERRILEEIERQFYREDPKLVDTVRNTSPATIARKNLRRASVGLVVGLAIMLASFTRSPFVALVGFGVMVVAAFFVVTSLRRRGLGRRGVGEPGAPSQWEAFMDRLHGRWRFRR